MGDEVDGVGSLPYGWQVSPIADLCDSIVDCVNKTAPVVDGPTPYRMIRTTNVRHGKVDLSGVRYVDESSYRIWTRRGVLRPGDIILTREAPLGEVGILKDASGVFLGQRLVSYRVNEDRCDNNFLLHAMRSDYVAAQIQAFGSGSTVEHMRVPDCSKLRILHPSPAAQRAIGSVLGAFDELIEINERRIEVLEDLARSLYREWFVRFRFPGHENVDLVDSDLGPIPERWAAKSAAEIFAINPRIKAAQSTFRKVTMGDVSQRVSVVSPSETATKATGTKFHRDDVLLARITPCLENGKTALVKFLEPGEVGIGSTEFIVLRGAVVGPAFTYCAARSDRLREHAIKSMSGASGRQRVSTDALKDLVIVEPPRALADRFEALAGPMLDEVFALHESNRALANTRDLLLPRLVTGQLDISEIDLGVLTPPEAA